MDTPTCVAQDGDLVSFRYEGRTVTVKAEFPKNATALAVVIGSRLIAKINKEKTPNKKATK